MTNYRITYRDPNPHKEVVEAESPEEAKATFKKNFQDMEVTNIEYLYPFEVTFTTLVTYTTTIEATDKQDAIRMLNLGCYKESEKISATEPEVIDVREIKND